MKMNIFKKIAVGTGMFWYPHLPSKLRCFIKKNRQYKIVKYAVEHSEFYRELYKDFPITRQMDFTKLPVVTKPMIAENFDKIVTDPTITKKEVSEFLENPQNANKLFHGKYTIAKTSGSSWTPVTIIHDSGYHAVFDCAFAIRGKVTYFPVCSIVSGRGFSIGLNSFMGNTDQKNYKLIDANAKTSDIVESLNKMQPAEIQSYPSAMLMLTYEQNRGTLHIHPKRIITSGETLTDNIRSFIKDTFGCEVLSLYASTETGYIGCECPCGHLHIYDDWLDIEPVDENGNPVKDGELSEKIIITNFSNKVQPIVRYEVTDMVRVVKNQRCPCGSRMPWVEVIGRSSDHFVFDCEGETRIVPRLHTLNYPDVVCWQNILYGQKRLEVRYLPREGVDHLGREKIEKFAFDEWTEAFRKYEIHGVEIYFSGKKPELDPFSGKLRMYIQKD